MVSSECNGMLYHWELDFGTDTSILGLRTMNPCGRMYILDTIISIKDLVSITGV